MPTPARLGAALAAAPLVAAPAWAQLAGTLDRNDQFGSALTTGDVDGDGYDDLAIGVPNEDLEGVDNAGAVQVMYGGNGGASYDRTVLLDQGAALPVAGEPDPGAALALSAAPNPSRSGTALRVALPEAGPVRLAVYDALGREVARLVDGPLGAGPHEVRLGAGRLPAGVYVVRLDAGALTRTRTVTLLR